MQELVELCTNVIFHAAGTIDNQNVTSCSTADNVKSRFGIGDIRFRIVVASKIGMLGYNRPNTA